MRDTWDPVRDWEAVHRESSKVKRDTVPEAKGERRSFERISSGQTIQNAREISNKN